MQKSSIFLRNERCPRCSENGRDKAGDNLGVWDDGHVYCWSCGFGVPGYKSLNVEDLKQLSKNKNKIEGTKLGNLCLPFDCTATLPKEPSEWLEKYGITERERLINHIVWSPSHERLIFPVFDLYGNLVIYQGRYFGSSVEAPRYSTRGKADATYHFIGNPSTSIVLVEDLVSAIKVGRQVQAMPLWGSQVSIERIIALSSRFSGLVVWLDRDKAKYALKARLRASCYFDEVRTIITDKDPKCYSEQEIKKYLS